MARLRYNGLTATLDADLLTAGTTITFTSALQHAAGAVPTITGTDYIPLSILANDGTVLEIMHLTAYTTGATTGTVLRAQEDTTATDHGSGLRVVHGLTVADADELAAGGGGSSGRVAARAYATATQAVPSGTATALNFGASSFEDGGDWWVSGTPSRLTVPAGCAGDYLVVGQVAFAYPGSGVVVAEIGHNGTLVSTAAFNGDNTGHAPAVTTLTLADGDYLQLFGFQNKGTSLNTDLTTRGGVHLTAFRL